MKKYLVALASCIALASQLNSMMSEADMLAMACKESQVAYGREQEWHKADNELLTKAVIASIMHADQQEQDKLELEESLMLVKALEELELAEESRTPPEPNKLTLTTSALKLTENKAAPQGGVFDAEQVCPICQDNLVDIVKEKGKDGVLQALCCKQYFCLEDFNEIIHQRDANCPLCRGKIL